MIHWLEVANGFEGTGLVNGDDHDLFRDFDGRPRAATWRPVPVRRYQDGKNWRTADFPFYASNAVFMRQSAVDALRDMLEACGEILPLATDDGVDLFVLNVTRVIDALDVERSELEYFDDGDRVMFIDGAAFHEPLVRDVDIFMVPQWTACTFVSHRFVERVREAGLVGLQFPPAWSPETGLMEYLLHR